jgi:ATP-dependent RNA helicase RhlE
MQKTFQELGVSEPVARALADRGIRTPFRVQALVLPDAMAGLDVLGSAPTGSGKTLAFGLAVVERTDRDDPTPSALVLVPTRELAVQVAEELALEGAPRGIRVASAYGGVPLAPQARQASDAHVVVATPGRLHDLTSRRLLSLAKVRILVLDEADRMLDMGFQPQVDRIVARLPRARQTMFFSATLDGEVGRLAREYTDNPSWFDASRGDEQASVVEHQFVAVTAETKVDALVSQLEREPGLTLVFVRTKRGADALLRKLERRGAEAVAMHGDMSQRARERALARFESGAVQTLIATDVAARGLDLDDIDHVVNFDPPDDEKGYVHRVGRTGRAGRGGHGTTLVLPEQHGDVGRIAARLGHVDAFERAGLRFAAPRLVYSGRRRGSRWGAPRRR